MNRSIYTKLAISNLKNNRKSYIPYVLTAILTVMMYYMMANLAANSPMNQEALQIILSLSVHVIEIFALIFLFYTNSFLIKRRKREIGVYHILGMGKPQLAKMLVIETVVTGAVSILGGIFFGTALAKLMYALLKRMIHYDDKLAFRMSWEIAGNTVLFFTLIFALTLIYNLFADPACQSDRASACGESGRAGAENQMVSDCGWHHFPWDRLLHCDYDKRTT